MIWHLGIKATHLEAQSIATAPFNWPGDDVMAVALPSKNALNKQVLVRYGGNTALCSVLDLGPWCIDDEDYVFGTDRPRAEQLEGKFCPRTVNGGCATVPDGKGFKAALISNGAGIDLFPGTATALRIPIGKNVQVDWIFDDAESEKDITHWA